MMHELRLHDERFCNIEKGVKRVEARLLDEKRQHIKIGDTIVFLNRDNPDKKILTTVTDLFFYKSFNEMFADLHKEYRSRCDREELEDSMLKYYPTEDEKKY